MVVFNMVDLFAGCGGLTEGFKQHGGFNTSASVEWDKYACKTLKTRLRDKWGYENAEKLVLQFDIQRTDELLNGYKDENYGNSDGLRSLVQENGGCDIVIGGPPCQAYSLAGRIRDEHGMENDYRNYLFESYLKTIEGLGSPKIILFENVPGMLSAAPGGVSIIKRITETFNNAGYDIIDDIRENALFNVSDFGVPQNRKRVILIGLKKESYGNNTKKYLKNIYDNIRSMAYEDKMTVEDALSGMDEFFPVKNVASNERKKYSHEPQEGKLKNSTPRYHSKRDIGIFKLLTEDIDKGINKYTSTKELKKLYTEKTGKESTVHKYYVLRNDKPSNTIPAHLYKDGLRHIHPDPKQARTITVREAARLQSFPDDFFFEGSSGANYKMIGNAVPPIFSKVLAKALHSFLSTEKSI
jgi:DNA (cytosine-5)-methyltransferase 1